MSTIVAELDGSVFRTTPMDALWLARALDGEGGDEKAVATTLLQRWVMLGGNERMTFGQLVQAYAQPVNINWGTEGRHCQPGGIGHGTPACEARVTARRDQRRVKTWDEIRDEAKDATVWALYSDEASDYLPQSVHFATEDLVAAKLRSTEARRDGWQVIEGLQPDGHSYVSTTASRAGDSDMRVIPGDLEELQQATEIGRGRQPAARDQVVDLAPIPITGEADDSGLLWLGLGAAALLLGAAAASQRKGRSTWT